jgi:hypothetical protein
LESLTGPAFVFPLHGGLLILFSIQLLCHKLIRPGVIPQERFPYQGRFPPSTRPDAVEDDGVDGDEDGMFSDKCISGSGAVWAFCLASGGLSGVIWVPFERRVSFQDAPGLPLGPLWALGTSGPCVGAS